MTVIRKILTGCGCIDTKMDGGISSETITLIYGEPETGKSTLAMQCAVNCASHGLKTLFIDCDNTFYPRRLFELSAGKFDEVAKLIILMKPKDFAEQTAIVEHIDDYISKNFGLVIIDTFNSLYRAQVSQTSNKKNTFGLNRELNRQMAILAQTAKLKHIPIVLTSQVKNIFNDTHVSVAPVAPRVLQFWADNVIALNPTENSGIIHAVLEKDRNTQESTCYLRIAETGIHDYESPY